MLRKDLVWSDGSRLQPTTGFYLAAFVGKAYDFGWFYL
jgi:hypothetical protein